MDVELQLLGVRDELGVLHGGGKGRAHRLGDGRRHVGRRDERPSDALAGIEELERLLVLGVLDQVEQERRVLDLGVRLGAGLEQHIDDALVEPVRALAVGAVIALADAVDLAAVDREDHVRRRGEAGDQLELRAEQAVERARIRIGAGADAGIADDRLVLQQIVEGLHLGAAVHEADIGFGRRRAEPGHLERIESRAGEPADRSERRVARDDAHHAAVLRRHRVDVIRRIEAAAARHVLRHHVGLARQVLADVAGDDAAPLVIAAAGPEPDHHRHVAAGEIRLLRQGRRQKPPTRRARQRDCAQSCRSGARTAWLDRTWFALLQCVPPALQAAGCRFFQPMERRRARAGRRVASPRGFRG